MLHQFHLIYFILVIRILKKSHISGSLVCIYKYAYVNMHVCVTNTAQDIRNYPTTYICSYALT